MSKIALKPNASGTGVFSLEAPNSNTDRTLTLPDEAGTVLTDSSSVTNTAGPAFSAYADGGNVSISNATYTKVIYDQENFDTDSCYDTSLYRFTPNVEGYYFIRAQVFSNWAVSNHTSWDISIFKNGAVAITSSVAVDGINYGDQDVSGVIYMNGSTDYVEIYVKPNGGSSPTYSRGQARTIFDGYFVRAA